MKTIRRQKTLKPILLAKLNEWLSQNHAVAGEKETATLHTTSLTFEKNPEGNIEADIKVCNGDTGPYVDAILFCDGNEKVVLEPSFETFDGLYTFEYAGKKYQAVIK